MNVSNYSSKGSEKFPACNSVNTSNVNHTSEIQFYNHPLFGQIRTVIVNDEPYFVGNDIATSLGYAKPRNAITQHVENEDALKWGIPDNQGLIQDTTIINESGMYSLVFGSKLPTAKDFKHWVTSEVLPSIRKHGAYMTSETLEKALTSPDFLIQLATNLKEEKQKRIEAEQKIQKDAPKVLFADAVSTSQRSCLVAELAKILQQNGVNIGQNRLFSWMRENGYLCQKGQYYNQPTQKAMELGLFELKKTTITKPDGSVLVTTTTKVTGKGQIYFVEKFLNKDAA